MVDTLSKMFWLLQKQERWKLAGLFVMTVIGALAEMFSVGIILPFVTLISTPERIQENDLLWQAYETLQMQSIAQFIIVLCVGAILLFLIKNIYIGLLTFVRLRFATRQRVALSLRLFRALMHSPYTFHLRQNTAELTHVLQVDVPRTTGQLLLQLLVLSTEALTISAIVLLLIVVDPLSFTIAVVLLGGISFAFYKFTRQTITRLARRGQTLGKEFFQWIEQGLGGIKEVKVLNRESFFVQALHQRSKGLAQVGMVTQTIRELPRLFNEFAVVLTVLLLIIFTAMRGDTIQSIVPTLALFAGAAFRLLPSITRATTSVSSILAAKPALDAVYKYTRLVEQEALQAARTSAEPPVRADAKETTEEDTSAAVVLSDVYYRYPNTTNDVLQGVSLCVPKNQSIGLVGPSGAGKTTLVDIMLGLLISDRGDVLVGGKSIHTDLSAVQRRIGYIPQSIYLIDDTIRANVAFGLPPTQIDDAQIWQALYLAQLADFVHTLPDGLDTIVGERGMRLSGGQRQRIGIARALYHDPDVLVMDEATAALDNITEQALVQAIEQLTRTKSLVIIAHRLTTVKHCDRLYLIQNGRIISSGTYAELCATSPEFQLLAGESTTKL